MANETLSIQKDDARLTIIGKSKADVYIDSGLGIDLDDLDIGSLDPFDLNWQTDVPDPDNLPDEIRIITPPTKTEYTDGEKINLDGMVVGAYKNGVIWTNVKYPNGHIPLGELIVTPLVVVSSYEIIDMGDYAPFYVLDYFSASGLVDMGNRFDKVGVTISAVGESKILVCVLLVNDGISISALAVSKIETDNSKLPDLNTKLADREWYRSIGDDPPEEHTDTIVSASSARWDSTYTYCCVSSSTGTAQTQQMSSMVSAYSGLPGSSKSRTSWNNMIKAYLNSGTEHSGSSKLSISWARPVDKNILTTSTNIQINEETSGGNGGR